MAESIEIFPVVVLTRVFAARPSSVPEIQGFIRGCMSDVLLPENDNRELNRTIMDVLLAAAGPAGKIQVSCRTYPDKVEFDVLPSVVECVHPVGRQPDESTSARSEVSAAEVPVATPTSFAEWIMDVLRREGLTREAAAKQLGVSVKTVSRWAGGETEPRLRELRRVQDRFGDMPFR
ncbi:helix-turn-helix transcriptional regulator [Lentzea sp. BCCO 10_0856]|uniref:Helix-turn-helix transcriptional regulator n=1 Tax=Lentzea miocenica TaxID=3095431 RepID=A0ABU4T9S6_9PSEU|nr:helix-turn-helix transcriptional regulator [Lentzea sp. BCCO 10_0856]MDX8034927.1 helix-turn-helix transcriptional regulator [Lentzea sp. BCCO 10_0856]